MRVAAFSVGWGVSSRLSAARRREVLPQLLIALRAQAGPRDLETDPLRYLHRYESPEDQEIVGWIAAALAFGRVRSIFQSIDRVLDRLGPSPSRIVRSGPEGALRIQLAGFRHRWIGGDDLAWALNRLGRIQAEQGTLEAALGTPRQSLPERLGAFSDRVLTDTPSPGRVARFLFPDPRRGSAAKRPLLFLRWLVRREPGLDLGLWRSVNPSSLIIPLDTHLAFYGRAFGWTRRKTADWKMAEEITAALRAVDPSDPVSFDWALSRLGILGRCRHRTVPALCRPCPLSRGCRFSPAPRLSHGLES